MTLESLTGSNVDLEGLSDVEDTLYFTDSKDFKQAIRDFFDEARHRDSLCDHTIRVIGFPAEKVIMDDDAIIDTDNVDDAIFDPDDDDDAITDPNYDDDAVIDTNYDDEPLTPRHVKILYLENLQTLFVTKAGLPHETARAMFDQLIYGKLMAMNCADEVALCGATLWEMTNVRKMADASLGPLTCRGRGTYITLALQVDAGASETARALARDATIWLEHPESHVAQVVVIKIFRRRPEIFFSVWKATQQETETRAGHPPRATEVQKVHVRLAQGRPVAEGTICLSFEELFERKPRLGTAEREDITFSAQDLVGLARVIWMEMEFIPRPPRP
jgi:hypothetical protein